MTGYEVAQEAIRTLLSGSREEMNKLLAAVDDSGPESTWSFKYPLGGIREGAQLAVDNELVRVWSVDAGTRTAVVERGLLGSDAGDGHLADSLVYVNPRFPTFAVVKAINEELHSLSSPSNGLYQVKSTDFPYNSAVSDYELPADATQIIDVYADSPGPSQAWMRVPHWSWNSNADTLDFPNGKSIRVPLAYQGRTVRVLYKADFGQIVDQHNDIELETGLPSSAHDILTLGVLMRLGPMREIKRNFTEAQRGDARRADEVPAGAVTNSFAWVRKQRETRIAEERLRLERLYPPRHPAR
jgi:hypothetical protein